MSEPKKPSVSDPVVGFQRDQEPETEETVHYDDAVVQRAYRWSGVAVVLLVVLGISGYVLANRRPAPALQEVKTRAAPARVVLPTAAIPVSPFTDVTREAGIAFSHVNGAYGEKLLPETMGGGVAFLDFDNDGAQDLLFVNSSYWPERVPAGASRPTMALYKNDGKGRFTDVTAGSGLDVSFYGMGVAVGDYDNDGLVDVFLSGVGGNHLFRNQGSGHAGVGGSGSDWSTSSAWVDYDNDGKLDLFVCNYVRWSREIDIEVGYKLVGLGRAYAQPMNFEGAFCYLYHNEGNGTFSDVSAQAGVQVKNPVTGVPAGKSLGIAPVDLDSDGRIDLVVANDGVQNFVFHNRGNGTFEEIGAASGIAFDSYGRARGAMGIDAGRYRNDDAMGILVANFATEMTALYVSQRDPLVFADETIPEGIGPPGLQLLKFGVFFFDYDLDGRADVLTVNGHLEEEIGKIQHGQQYRQPAQLFWNAGLRASGGCYLPVPPDKCGVDLFQPLVGRGSAFADIDADGDPDVVMTQTGGPPLLLRNDQNLGHNWLRLKLVGAKTNRDAIGTWIRVRVGEHVLWRQVMPARSYLSQSELPVSIGLGSASQADEIEVIWIGGERQQVTIPAVNTTTVVAEGR
jgi:hypothetical protein